MRWSVILSIFVMLVITLVMGGWLTHVAMHRPAFAIDSAQPFHIEFGRGSGWHGLDTVKLDQTGRVVLHRCRYERRPDAIRGFLETTTLQLSPEALAEVLKSVESNNLLGLSKKYTTNINDGTQWILWVKQGEHEMSVYCDNSFPYAISSFADELDAVLDRAAIAKATWVPVPPSESRDHENALWDSIRR